MQNGFQAFSLGYDMSVMFPTHFQNTTDMKTFPAFKRIEVTLIQNFRMH